MPITTTSIEAQRIVKNRADSITRFYSNGKCPVEAGQKETLYVVPPGADKPVAYAYITVKNVRMCSMKERTSGPLAEKLALGEGFGAPESWASNIRSLYGAAPFSDEDKDSLARIRFDVDKLVKV